jgi:hypothetical protein
MTIFDANGLEIPLPKEEDLEHICELGGQFDECCYYIEFHDELLDREKISIELGLTPTNAWNAGERHVVGNGKSGRTRTDTIGKWSLKVDVTHGSISDALQEFFLGSTAPLETWRQLGIQWNGQVALVGKARNWNREFNLSREVVACISERGLNLNFDAYFYGVEIDE